MIARVRPLFDDGAPAVEALDLALLVSTIHVSVVRETRLVNVGREAEQSPQKCPPRIEILLNTEDAFRTKDHIGLKRCPKIIRTNRLIIHIYIRIIYPV